MSFRRTHELGEESAADRHVGRHVVDPAVVPVQMVFVA